MPHNKPPEPPSIEELGRLPVFPLPNAVFFPYTLLPLHVFEPRYRQLVRDALSKDLPIAVPLLREGSAPDASGRLRFHRIAGVGRVVDHTPLADDRSNIVLRGVGRVFITREIESDRRYRIVEAELIEVPPVEDDWATSALERLRQCVLALNRARPKLGGPLVETLAKAPTLEPLVNTLSAVVYPEAERRQEILAEPSLEGRYDVVVGRLTELLAQLGGPQPGS